MNCQRCGSKLEKEWTFCPRCGFRLGGDFFEDIFSRMRKEITQMNKLFEKDIEAFDLSPWFKDMEKRKIELNPKSSGFTIKIIQSGGREPHVSVRTFGDVNKDKLKKQIDEIGVWQPEFGTARKVAVGQPLDRVQAEKPGRQQFREPSVTEEPKTTVKRTASNVIVEMELPGVKSPSDISVSELENSIEVKAMAGDKAYFKILTKPPQFKLAKKYFSSEKLHIEFS